MSRPQHRLLSGRNLTTAATTTITTANSTTTNTTNPSSSSGAELDGVWDSNRYVSVNVTTSVGRTTVMHGKVKEEFYQSYNPQIGLHTAAVLGGILAWLVVYLAYKTKVENHVTTRRVFRTG